MALTKSALELLFDRLNHDEYKYIPGILQDAVDEYRVLVDELDKDEKRKVNYIRSMIEYCFSERWNLAKNQSQPAREEYYRYFFRKLNTAKLKKRSPVMLRSDLPTAQKRESRMSDSRRGRPASETYPQRKDVPVRPSSEKPQISKKPCPATDLSDLGTLQKIAAKFGEIYKNEWVDALHELEEFRISEMNAITCLLRIVMDAYRLCTVEADSQIAKLEDAAFDILMEGNYSHGERQSGHRQYLLEYRRSIAYICIERLQETFRRRYIPEIIRSIGVYQNIRTHGSVHRYANQCVAICWGMAIIHPQVYVKDDRDRLRLLDREFYNIYTRSGPSVDFFVWPPLLTHKNGKLLSKGIAQGQ